MKLTVKYFASMRDKMGRGEDAVTVDNEAATVEQVWKQVSNGQDMPANTLIAVNMEYTDAQAAVKDGDEIAFFPPVTGG
jgi:molybdopterin synthase sulfur carrier subunit